MDRQPSAPGASAISEGSGNLGPPSGGTRGVVPPRPAEFGSIEALLVTPLCAGPHRRRWHSGTAGSMAYATISPGQILGHAPKQAHGSFVVCPCRHRDLPG